MKYQQAKKLFNGDEVFVKETKEITKVVNTEVGNKFVFIHLNTSNGYKVLNHREIK